MARALVLGSSGMVGRAVLGSLLDLGWDVVRTKRSQDGDGGAVAFDAREPSGLDSLVAGADLVVNAIGVLRSDPDYPGPGYRLRAAQVNALFPLLLGEAAGREGARVVHISTDAVFAPAEHPADERTAVSPLEPYGLTKALGEAETEAIVNIRCSVIGPAPDRGTGLWEWLVGQPQGAEITGFTTPWSGVTSRQLAVLCGDLADASTFDKVRAAGPTHHFVPNEPITKFELLTELVSALRPDLTLAKGELAQASRVLDTSTNAFDHVFSGPRGWQEALHDAIAHA